MFVIIIIVIVIVVIIICNSLQLLVINWSDYCSMTNETHFWHATP